MIAFYIALIAGAILSFFVYLLHLVAKQGERLKAMGLGIQFLIEKSELKPSTYIMDRLREALKE